MLIINVHIIVGLQHFFYAAWLVFSGYQFWTHSKNSSSSSNVPTSVTSLFAGVITEGNGYNWQHGIQFTGDQTDT